MGDGGLTEIEDRSKIYPLSTIHYSLKPNPSQLGFRIYVR